MTDGGIRIRFTNKGDVVNSNRDRVVYIAGPYRDATGSGIDDNIHRAREIAKKYWRLGYTVICPHLNSAHMDGLIPDEEFLAAGLELLKRSDIVVLVPGWEESKGTQEERAVALHFGKVIIVEG